MKYLSYAWMIFLDLVAVGVVILIFSRDLQPFERIAISLLVMIYLNSISGTAVTVQQAIGIHLTLAKHILRVESSSRDWPADEAEDARRMLEEQTEHVRQAQTKYYVNAVFSAIGYFIALANLVRAVWSS